MKLIYNKVFLEHDTGNHPENKNRLLAIVDKLRVKETKLNGVNGIENGEKYLELVHDKNYIEKVKKICEDGGGMFDLDTVVSSGSYKSAVYAVGATVMASEIGGFALVRPPGHHAYSNKAGGFCIFNNIAIAVAKLVKEGKKVMIFDFDGHLGDGTEYFFYNSNKVLYMSLHQYPAYPGEGVVEQIGVDDGEGYTVNIPLPADVGDDIYLDAVKKLIEIGKQFNPDVVAVSAGFDGYKDDLLLNLNLSFNSYYKIGKLLRENFKNIFAVLEGGYNIEKLPGCVGSFLEGVGGEKQRFVEEETESSESVWEEYKERIKELDKNLKRFWKSVKKNEDK